MKILPALIMVTALINACGAPPNRPESLWDSFPDSEDGTAKTVPAQVWTEQEEPTETVSEPAESPPSPPDPEMEDQVFGKVVLNEIYYDAVGSDTDGVLFVELFGTAGMRIGGYKIVFVDGGDGSADDSITLPEDAVLLEDGFYVVADAKTGLPNATDVPNADLIDNFDPQNGPDAVQLLDADGALLDAIGYGENVSTTAENGLGAFEGIPAADVVNGHSLERQVPGHDTQDNSLDLVEREVPTPGA